MPVDKRFDPDEWFSFAFTDLSAAKLLRTDSNQVNNTIWHCQQAVEKAIKGYLLAHGEQFRFTHDLLELSESLSVTPLLAHAKQQLNRLTVLAMEGRYPGAYDKAASLDEELAFELAVDTVQLLHGEYMKLPPKT